MRRQEALALLLASLATAGVACSRGSEEHGAAGTVSARATASAPPIESARKPEPIKVRSPSSISSSSGFSVRRCPPAKDDTFFFPKRSLGFREPHFDADAFRRRWYSLALRAMAEPSLSCESVAGETYRFLWLRSFHPQIAVRVEAMAAGARLTAFEQEYGGNRTNRTLSTDEWNLLQEALDRADFWTTDPWVRRGGPDGAQWVFEGRLDSRYQVVDRWTPHSGPIRELGLLFIRLSKISVPEKDVY
ncbi:MAG TPA: hypothetical protein VM686_01050 [Polyangiaceae bacterium]|jgi:hypothetical protein|nr:hypothetical protein [Polyangiaceae bacterium]